MPYRSTGRVIKPESVDLVREELCQEQAPSTGPPSTNDRTSGASNSQLTTISNEYYFYLTSESRGNYTEAGYTKYFSSRNQAKKTRNVLNKKFGGSCYFIKKELTSEVIKEYMGFYD